MFFQIIFYFLLNKYFDTFNNIFAHKVCKYIISRPLIKHSINIDTLAKTKLTSYKQTLSENFIFWYILCDSLINVAHESGK